jgi:hypothetical protein
VSVQVIKSLREFQCESARAHPYSSPKRRAPLYEVLEPEHRWSSFGVPYIAKAHLKLKQAAA